MPPYTPPPALHSPPVPSGMQRKIVVESHTTVAWVGVGVLLAIGTAAIVLGTQARAAKEGAR
jgi:hypothetical protein